MTAFNHVSGTVSFSFQYNRSVIHYANFAMEPAGPMPTYSVGSTMELHDGSSGTLIKAMGKVIDIHYYTVTDNSGNLSNNMTIICEDSRIMP